MSYCTTTDVAGLNPKRTYDTTSQPTLAQVQEYVDRIAAEIDVIVGGRGLTTPVTEPTALVTFLKQTNAHGAAAMAEQAMFPESKGMMTTPAAQVLWKKYQDALSFLKEGNLPEEATGDALPFGFFTNESGQSSTPKETYKWQRPAFGKNKEF